MIENRNEYTTHMSQHQQDMNLFRRQNVYQQFLKKDVQVYEDSTQQQSMLEQMKIPINDDQIQIPDWLEMIFHDFNVPLKQAQYINIYDPVEKSYIDITNHRQISSYNFKHASPIYIRYLPYQETAVPPHANLQSMMEENYYSTAQGSVNPLYSTQQGVQFNNTVSSSSTSASNTSANWIPQQQQSQTQQNSKTQARKSSYNQPLTTLSYQRANSDFGINNSTNIISANSSSSIRAKRQSESSSKNNYGMQTTNNLFNSTTYHGNSHNSDGMNLNYDNSHIGDRKLIDQLKQEASSSSPSDRDENVMKNLKMEDQGNSFASTISSSNGYLSNNKSLQLSLKKEDTHEFTDPMQNSGELHATLSLTSNNSSSQKYNINGRPRHKDSDLSLKDTCPTTQQSDQQIKNHKQLPREKRVKERQISYVKGKVDEWRNLYDNGRVNPRGEIEKVNLDVAASLVGLSRKTLDDYYAQLRKAQKYGFDFDSNSSEKMGTLRKYVKKMSDKDVNAGSDDSIDTDNNTSSKSNFNTPQLKPSIPSDLHKQELSMSVGHPSNSRKFSDNNLDLIRQNTLPLKHNLSAPPQQQQSLLNQIKMEHNAFPILNGIASQENFLQSEQQRQMIRPTSILSQLQSEPQQFKLENPNFDDKANDTCMNLEEIENEENNMCGEGEPIEEEEDFTDYINSENNPKQEQNDDQFN